jgi:hypothetical protein
LFFRRSQAWPFWAEPSLRTIFVVKNERCYCRYIGRISFPLMNPVSSRFCRFKNQLPLRCTTADHSLLRRAQRGARARRGLRMTRRQNGSGI